MERLLSTSLILLGFSALCGCSRVSLGSELETFTSLPLNSDPADVTNIITRSIQEDKWIPGNVLATIGSSVYTISPSGLPTKLTGSVQEEGLKNGIGTEARFNLTSSLVQLKEGREVIIADFYNGCLRRLDRSTSVVSTFAGTCLSYSMKARDHNRTHFCLPIRDGSALAATFCSPISMQYQESKNSIFILDLAGTNKTRIRSINLTSLIVTTVFYNSTFSARGFLVDEENKYNIAVSPGILQIDMQTKESKWLVGCGNETYILSKCPAQQRLRNLSLKFPRVLMKYDGLYIVSDQFGDQVYIIDLEHAQYASVCQFTYPGRCSLYPASVAVIGEYLYVGESVSSRLPYGAVVRIKRIRFSAEIYDPLEDSWLERERTTRTTTRSNLWLGRKSTTITRKGNGFYPWLMRTSTTAYHYHYYNSTTETPRMDNSEGSIGGIIAAIIIPIVVIGAIAARCRRRHSGNTGNTRQRMVSQQTTRSRVLQILVGRQIMRVRVPHTRLRETNSTPITGGSSAASSIIRITPRDAPVPEELGTIQPFSIPTPEYPLPEAEPQPPPYSELDGISTVENNANPPPYEE